MRATLPHPRRRSREGPDRQGRQLLPRGGTRVSPRASHDAGSAQWNHERTQEPHPRQGRPGARRRQATKPKRRQATRTPQGTGPRPPALTQRAKAVHGPDAGRQGKTPQTSPQRRTRSAPPRRRGESEHRPAERSPRQVRRRPKARRRNRRERPPHPRKRRRRRRALKTTARSTGPHRHGRDL